MFSLSLASFFCFGMVLVVLGANQAGLEHDLGLNLSETGFLAAMLSIGVAVGEVSAGPLFDRVARRPLFIVAATLSGVALLAIQPGISFVGACALIGLVGVGIGAYDTLFNAGIVERFGDAAAKRMAIAHSAATIGAMLCPLLAAVITTHWHWTRSFHVIGAALLLLAGLALGVRFPARAADGHDSDRSRSVLSIRLLPFALVAFAYVGIEGSLNIFAVPYATDGLGLETARGQSAISAFWFGLLIGRLGPLLLPVRLDARWLVGAGVLAASWLGVSTASGSGYIELLFGGVGVAMGIIYPLMISLVGLQFPNARGTAVGLVAAVGALGGFSIPWLTGVVGDGFGIAVAISTMAVWCVTIALGSFGMNRSA